MLTRIKALRHEHGFTQRALAELLGISQQSINKYENHNIEPDIGTLRRIAEVFDVSVDYLVEHTDERLPPVLADTTVFLSSTESRLVNDYRRLSSAERESIELVIQNYLIKR